MTAAIAFKVFLPTLLQEQKKEPGMELPVFPGHQCGRNSGNLKMDPKEDKKLSGVRHKDHPPKYPLFNGN